MFRERVFLVCPFPYFCKSFFLLKNATMSSIKRRAAHTARIDRFDWTLTALALSSLCADQLKFYC